MIDRVLGISEEPARISIRNGLPVLEVGGLESDRSLRRARLGGDRSPTSQFDAIGAYCCELAKARALLITCDDKYAPASVMLPLKKRSRASGTFPAAGRDVRTD